MTERQRLGTASQADLIGRFECDGNVAACLQEQGHLRQGVADGDTASTKARTPISAS